MERSTIISETNIDGNTVTIKSNVEEKMTEAEVRQNIVGCERQMFDIKQQMMALKARYEDISKAKGKYQEILDQMPQSLPEISQ